MSRHWEGILLNWQVQSGHSGGERTVPREVKGACPQGLSQPTHLPLGHPDGNWGGDRLSGAKLTLAFSLCSASPRPLPAITLLPIGSVLSEPHGEGTVPLPPELPRRRDSVSAPGPMQHQQRQLSQQLHHMSVPGARQGELGPVPGGPSLHLPTLAWDPGQIKGLRDLQLPHL